MALDGFLAWREGTLLWLYVVTWLPKFLGCWDDTLCVSDETIQDPLGQWLFKTAFQHWNWHGQWETYDHHWKCMVLDTVPLVASVNNTNRLFPTLVWLVNHVDNMWLQVLDSLTDCINISFSLHLNLHLWTHLQHPCRLMNSYHLLVHLMLKIARLTYVHQGRAVGGWSFAFIDHQREKSKMVSKRYKARS